MEYTKLAYNEDGVTFATETFALPKNNLDKVRFEGAFRATVEKRILSDALAKISRFDVDNLTADNIVFVDMVEEYQKQMGDFDFTTITSDDERFIVNMVNSFLGFPKMGKGQKLGIAGHAILDDVLKKELPKYYHNQKVDVKALKDAFNEWVNDRLKTNNESGLFKNFTVKFTDEMTIRVLAATRHDIRLTTRGIKEYETALPIIAQKILVVALDKTFNWRMAKTTKSSLVTVLC